MTFEEALAILQVSLPTTAAEAAKAFRKRAKETHPDVGGDPAEFLRVTKALEIVYEGLSEARVDAGPVYWDRRTGTISWRQVARDQMTARQGEIGVEIGIELTREQTDWMLLNPDAGGDALGQVLQEGARAFMRANPQKKRLT